MPHGLAGTGRPGCQREDGEESARLTMDETSGSSGLGDSSRSYIDMKTSDGESSA